MNKNNEEEKTGKELWKKVKYELIDYNSIPPFMKDNEFILRYYRAHWPIQHLFLSIFKIHNETLNVWTHLIGFFLFLALTVYTAISIPKVVDIHMLHHFQEVLKKADLHKLHNELLGCFPSLPNMPDLHRFLQDLASSLASPSSWHIIKLLTNCLPEQLFTENHTLLHSVKEDITKMTSPMVPNPVTRWPMFVFLAGAMFCLLGSSTCHLLACHSERISYIVHRIDYTGIAVLITTSFYPVVYYTFMCNPFFCTLYLGSITLLGICTVIVSLLPMFQKPEFRVMRTSLFIGMGLSGIVPVFHKLALFWDSPVAFHTTGYEVLMGLLYICGALFYTTRIPERWMPGKFDIACNSHNIFHVFVVAAAYTHYQDGLIYLGWRDLEGC